MKRQLKRLPLVLGSTNAKSHRYAHRWLLEYSHRQPQTENIKKSQIGVKGETSDSLEKLKGYPRIPSRLENTKTT